MQKPNTTSSSQNTICSSIDIGSNTIRVIVARCRAEGFEVLASDEELVRIGESVNATGSISEQKQAMAIAVLRKYQALAEKHHAQYCFAVATEAIRKAANREEFLAAIQDETGLEISIIGGDVEALLTFYGATADLQHAPNPPEHVGVVDVGGGSMELVSARQLQIDWHSSIPVGSGSVHDRYLSADLPTRDDLAAARSFLDASFQVLPSKNVPPVLLATGGSANTLLKLARRAFSLDEASNILTHDDLVRSEGIFCALSATAIARRYHIEQARARILLAGILILRTLLEYWELSELSVSSGGLREGVLLAYTRYGEQWLSALQSVATGEHATSKMGEELFVQSGRRLLRERAQKMLDLRKDVLKDKDIEAVHKMRVASRRLRAVLDAYESVSQTKLFKKVYRATKETAAILGEARDTDVMIANLQAQLAQTPVEEQDGIRWLMQHLTNYRQQVQKQLTGFLGEIDASTFLEQVVACLPEGGQPDGQS